MNIVITGGAGFIGSSLAETLHLEHDVTILDNLSLSRRDNIKKLKVKFHELDLTEYHSIYEEIFSKADVVYHLAASLGVQNVLNNPGTTFINNMKISHTLFPLFKKYNNKVIFGSTSEVYGETKEGGASEDDILKIMSTTSNRGGYAAAKIHDEFYLKYSGIPYVIVRFFNIVGPKQVGDFGHVLPRFLQAAHTDQPILINGLGDQTRSFCDIRDAIEMLKIFLDDEHNGNTYNVGAENSISILGLANEIKKCFDKDIKIEFNNSIQEEIYERKPDLTKIRKYYKNKYSINQIIGNIYETNFSSSSSS